MPFFRIMKTANDSVVAANGFRTGVFSEPAGGERLLALPGAEQGTWIKIGHNISIQEPERLVEEPVRIAQGTAGAEDDGFEDRSNAQVSNGLTARWRTMGPGA